MPSSNLDSGEETAGTVLRGALIGSAVVAILLVVESVVAGLLDVGPAALERLPFVSGVLGVVGGAAAGGVLTAAVGFGRSGVSAAARLRRALFLLVAGALATISVVQLRYRLLDEMASDARVAAFAVATFVAWSLTWWILRRPAAVAVARAARAPIRRVLWLCGGVLALSFAVGALDATLIAAVEASSGRAGLSVWRPAPSGPASRIAATEGGNRDLLVVGIDGARWEVLEPLIAAGELPNIASLLARGRRGVLRSSEDASSPIDWTTILTGKRPGLHGIREWHLAHSGNRRVEALWGILEELGRTTAVVNVPGSYPAEPGGGGIVAGIPLPQTTGSPVGWIVARTGDVHPGGPELVRIPERIAPGRRFDVVLRGPLEESPVTTTGYLLQEVGIDALSAGLLSSERRLVSMRLEIVSPSAGTGNGQRVLGRNPSTGEVLFDLTEGQWGRWLSTTVDGRQHVVRVRALDVGADELRLFVTPLFPRKVPGLTSPPELGEWLERRIGRPLIVEGTGWQVFFEESMLGSLEEELVDTARTKGRAALALMETMPWDAFIQVFTVTDRAQHAFWKFREPELYRRLTPESEAGLLPTPEQVEAHGGAIDRLYREVDLWIGRMLRHVDDSTLVVLLSDHGGKGGPHPLFPTAGIHHEDGIYLIAGPTVAAPGTAGGRLPIGPELDQIDVLPLILAHLGLPSALDLEGSVPDELAPRAPDGSRLALVPPVPTYEDLAGGDEARVELDPRSRDQLRALGYIR